MAGGKGSYLALKSQTEYLKLILSNIVNRMGDSLDSLVFSWVMYEVTGSASMVALIFAINYLPSVLLTPLTSVLVDRYPKKRVMVACDTGRAALVALTGLLLRAGLLSAAPLIAVTLCSSTLECFRVPAGVSIVPRILAKDHYTTGLALNQTVSRVSEIIGKAAAGFLTAALGSANALLLDASAFVVSGVIISFIRIREDKAPDTTRPRDILEGFLGGLRYLRSSRMVVALTLMGVLFNLFGVPIDAFQSVYVGDVLRMGPETLSFFSVTITVGLAVGAFVCPPVKKRLGGRRCMVLGGVTYSLAMALLGLLPVWMDSKIFFILLGLDLLLYGLGNGLVNVVFNAALFSSVDQTYLARVSGILTSILYVALPVGSFACSLLARWFPVTVILLCGGLLTAPAFLLCFKVEELRKL